MLSGIGIKNHGLTKKKNNKYICTSFQNEQNFNVGKRRKKSLLILYVMNLDTRERERRRIFKKINNKHVRTNKKFAQKKKVLIPTHTTTENEFSHC